MTVGGLTTGSHLVSPEGQNCEIQNPILNHLTQDVPPPGFSHQPARVAETLHRDAGEHELLYVVCQCIHVVPCRPPWTSLCEFIYLLKNLFFYDTIADRIAS